MFNLFQVFRPTLTQQIDQHELIFFQDVGANTILQDIARARENIQKSLAGVRAYSLLNYLYFTFYTDVKTKTQNKPPSSLVSQIKDPPWVVFL